MAHLLAVSLSGRNGGRGWGWVELVADMSLQGALAALALVALCLSVFVSL